jgi:hypothetical protein
MRTKMRNGMRDPEHTANAWSVVLSGLMISAGILAMGE